MSYILDALKKADQERQQGEIPTLNSTSTLTSQSASSRPIVWIVSLAIIAAALLWLQPWQQPPVESTPSTQTKPAPEAGPEVATQPTASVASPTRKATPTTTSTQKTEMVDDSEPVGIMELPAHIRNALPPIKISGHIYDETPADRMVIINDAVRREGRHISDALLLEAITEKGIILNYNGTRFFMSTFDSWPR